MHFVALRRLASSNYGLLTQRSQLPSSRDASFIRLDTSRHQRHHHQRIQKQQYHDYHHKIVIHPAVQDALRQNRPVVALESTILAHGMPYPENWRLVHRLSQIFESYQVQPATVAVQNGFCRVGLEFDELHDLCLAGEQGRATKCSTRELPWMMSYKTMQRISNSQDDPEFHRETKNTASDAATQATSATTTWGATTVASTMLLAHRAGIATFCTGGIGGVHRGGEDSMDVSADLSELGRTPVIVVSAGIKSILDIPRTLEVLETNGVLPLAYQTDEFPAFFSAHSGVRAPARVESAEQVAAMYWAARDLQLSQGMVLAVPNRDPAGAAVEEAIQSTLQEAQQQNISGQAVTPFILKRVAEQTKGDSLRSNLALVEQNAHVSAQVAIAICEEQRRRQHSTLVFGSDKAPAQPRGQSRVVVMGGCVFDFMCKPKPGQELLLRTSNPATCKEVDGGVGRNVAEVLGRLGEAPLFYSAVGRDARGQGMLQRLTSDMGVQVKDSVKTVDKHSTATYVAAFDGTGDLHTAFADMSIMEEIAIPSANILQGASVLIMDANPPIHTLRMAAQQASENGVEVMLEPTSIPKASKVAQDLEFMKHVTAAFPNGAELTAMASALDSSLSNSPSEHDQSLETLQAMAVTVLQHMSPERAYLVITLGAQGVLLATRESTIQSTQFIHCPPKANVKVVNSSGAGDSLCGAFVHAVLQGKSLVEAVSIGMEAAALSLACADRTVSSKISREALNV